MTAPSKHSGLLSAGVTFLVFMLAMFGGCSARAGDVTSGKITAIKEGNLVTFDYGGGTYDVRLVGVVIPENASSPARQYLEKLLNKPARLRLESREPDGVIEGKIYATDPETGKFSDIGLAMVSAGRADIELGKIPTNTTSC